IRIKFDRLFEEMDSLIQSFTTPREEFYPGLGERLISFNHIGLSLADPYELPAMQGDIEIPREFINDLVLQIENLAHPPVNLHGLDHFARGDFDEARSDAQHFADALITASDNPPGADLPADASGEFFVELGLVFGAPAAKHFVNQFAPDD